MWPKKNTLRWARYEKNAIVDGRLENDKSAAGVRVEDAEDGVKWRSRTIQKVVDEFNGRAKKKK